jgi:hypothetical protein
MTSSTCCSDLTRASNSKLLEVPSSAEHTRWVQFSKKHAPLLHKHQTDASRIESVLFFWAIHHGYLHPENKVRLRTSEPPYFAYETAATLSTRREGKTYRVKAVRAFPWVDKLCDKHLTMWRKYLDTPPADRPDSALHVLEEGSVFCMDTLRDCLLDHDTARDVITALNDCGRNNNNNNNNNNKH